MLFEIFVLFVMSVWEMICSMKQEDSAGTTCCEIADTVEEKPVHRVSVIELEALISEITNENHSPEYVLLRVAHVFDMPRHSNMHTLFWKVIMKIHPDKNNMNASNQYSILFSAVNHFQAYYTSSDTIDRKVALAFALHSDGKTCLMRGLDDDILRTIAAMM